MPRRRWVLAVVGAGVHVCFLSGCMLGGAAKSGLPVVAEYMPEPDTLPLGDLRQETPAFVVQRPPAPPPPETPKPKLVEQSAEVVAPAPPAPAPQLPPDPPAVAALRAYLDPSSEAARKFFARLGDTDRTVLDALAPVVASAGTGDLDHATPAAIDQILRQVELLEDKLRERGSLTLSKVCFTRNLDGFGVYEPLAPPDGCPVFQGGLDGRPGERVQVYVEVRGFASRKAGACWKSALASTLEIRAISLVDDPASAPAVVLRRPARPDLSLSPRQDYFLNIQFHIPPRLPPGRYQLRVEVRDDLTARVRDRVLEFRVEPPH